MLNYGAVQVWVRQCRPPDTALAPPGRCFCLFVVVEPVLRTGGAAGDGGSTSVADVTGARACPPRAHRLSTDLVEMVVAKLRRACHLPASVRLFQGCGTEPARPSACLAH